MYRLILVLILMLFAFSTQVWAGFDEGFAAYKAKDFAVALKELTPEANKGNAKAQLFLGAMYYNGEGVARNITDAINWFRKSAEHGNATAQDNLGNLYLSGEGVEKNATEAANWYRKAAEQGYTGAQTSLGFLYYNGDGIAQDKAEAFKWFNKAAEKGNAAAQNNLGFMYEKGEGVAQNKAEALKWYQKSVDQDYELAQANLKNMRENDAKEIFIKNGLKPPTQPGGSIHKGKIITVKKALSRKYYELNEEGKKIWVYIPDESDATVGDEVIFSSFKPEPPFRSSVLNQTLDPFYYGLEMKVLNRVMPASPQANKTASEQPFDSDNIKKCPLPEEAAESWGNRMLENIGAVCKQEGMMSKDALKWIKEYSRLNKLSGDESNALLRTNRQRENRYIESYYWFLRGWNGDIIDSASWNQECDNDLCKYNYKDIGLQFDAAKSGTNKYRIKVTHTDFPFGKEISSQLKKNKIVVKNYSENELLKRVSLIRLDAAAEDFFMDTFCIDYLNEDYDINLNEKFHSSVAYGYDILRNGLNKKDELTLYFIKELMADNGKSISTNNAGRYYGWDASLIVRNRCVPNSEKFKEKIQEIKQKDKSSN